MGINMDDCRITNFVDTCSDSEGETCKGKEQTLSDIICAEDLKVREARADDVARIIEIMTEDVFGKEREDYRLPIPQCYIEAFNNIKADKNNKLLVVCDAKDRVLGGLQITFTQYLSYKGSSRATLENVYIAKDSRGQGAGTVLMRYAIEMARARGCSMVQLTTNKARKDAHRFYERLGFHATHEGMKFVIDK